MPQRVQDLAAAVPALDPDAHDAAVARHARLAKPPGSLGALEQVGAQLAAIAGTCPPPVPVRPAVVVAAGDHGVHARGVSAWPQQVTTVMVDTFCQGGAACGVLAELVGARLVALDVGVAGDPSSHDRLRSHKIARGTRDLVSGDAMTVGEAAAAVVAGAEVVDEVVAAGADLVAVGDMGIANTTASAALIAALTGTDPGEVVGPGAGADDSVMQRKRAAVAAGVTRYRTRTAEASPSTPAAAAERALAALAAVGGLEHAALVGVMLRAAARRVPVVVDGVITDAAALVACAMAPDLRAYLVAGHRSAEPGADIALDRLGLKPLLDLGMRLGEGSGALLAVPLVQAAARVLADMATLDDLGVAGGG